MFPRLTPGARARFLALTAVITLSASACGGPDTGTQPGPVIHTYNLVAPGASTFTPLTLTVDENLKMTLDAIDDTVSPSKAYHVTGTCAAPSSGFQVQPCTVDTSDWAGTLPVGTALKIKEIPGVAVILGIRPPGSSLPVVAADVIEGPAVLWEASNDCTVPNDDFGMISAGATNATVSVARIDLNNSTFRRADFELQGTATTPFASHYNTVAGGGNGLENVISAVCTNGLWKTQIVPTGGGVADKRIAFTSPAGITVNDQMLGVPKTLAITSLDQLSNKNYEGIVINIGLGAQVGDSFELSTGPKAANEAVVSAYSSATGNNNLQNMTILAAADPVAAGRFSEATGATNGLAVKYPTAAKIPGLFYSPEHNGAGEEQPTLLLNLTSKVTGKTVIFGLQTSRTGATISLSGYFFATEK